MKPPVRRVLFLSGCVRGGGAGWSLYYLLKHLDRSRIEPIVVVPEPGIFAERFAELGLRVIEMPALTERTNRQRFRTNNWFTRGTSVALNAVSNLSCAPRIASLVRRERVDIIYCNHMMVKAVGVLAARLAGVPAVLHARNLHEKRARIRFYGTLARSRRTRLVIANSAASAVPYQRYAPGKVVVVWNGIDMDEYRAEQVSSGTFRRELGLAAGETLVGFTGNLIPRKGLVPLIQAAARVLARLPEVRFVALGRVPIGSPVDHLADYARLVRDLGIADRFFFAGFRDDVRPAVKDLDVLVLPSFQEPFGRSIIEAMALGTPVVASRVGGVPEILVHGENGLMTDPGNVDQLAEAIEALIENPELRERLASAARRTVAEKFDVAKLTRRIEDLLMAL